MVLFACGSASTNNVLYSNTAKLAAKQKDKFFKAALAALDRLVKSDPRGQDVGGYAFDIARAFQGVNGRELARAYNEIQ